MNDSSQCRNPAQVNKEHLEKLRHKKEVYKRWKQGLVILEEYADNVCVCRNGFRKAKIPGAKSGKEHKW